MALAEWIALRNRLLLPSFLLHLYLSFALAESSFVVASIAFSLSVVVAVVLLVFALVALSFVALPFPLLIAPVFPFP